MKCVTEFARACCDQRPFVLAIDGVEVIDDQIIAIIRAVRNAKLPVIIVLAGSDPVVQSGQKVPKWLAWAREESSSPLNEEELLDESVTNWFGSDLTKRLGW